MNLITGVYAIFSTSTGECLYVGQSNNILERYSTHLKMLKAKTHPCTKFSEWYHSQNCLENSLIFTILEECANNDLTKNQLEIKWFTILQPRFFGKTPSTRNSWSHSEETKTKISHSLQKRSGNFTGEPHNKKTICKTCHLKKKLKGKLQCSSCQRACALCKFDLQNKEKILHERNKGKSLRKISLELGLSNSTKTILLALRRYGADSSRKAHNYSS